MERIDAIAYPGLTANFDAAKSAALAMGLLDWKVHGRAYASAMGATAVALAEALERRGLPVFRTGRGATASHQFRAGGGGLWRGAGGVEAVAQGECAGVRDRVAEWGWRGM